MKKIVLTVISSFCIFNIHAQEHSSQLETNFIREVNDISYDIDVIIKDNKEKLTHDLNEINGRVENNELSNEEAGKLRSEKTKYYVQKIEEETKLQENLIKKLINHEIEENIDFGSDMIAYRKNIIEKKTLTVVDYYYGQSRMLYDNKSEKNIYDNKFLHSFGAKLSVGVKTRLGKEQSRIFWKPTFDVGLHYLRLNNNKTIENIDNETVLVDSEYALNQSFIYTTEFTLSNYFEYDFSKRKTDEFGNYIIKSRQSFFVGLGVFLGYSQLGKQLNYKLDGEEYRENTISKFNSNPFVYGVGAYVGYQNFSLKTTYNLNNVFKRSFADQNIFNISLGLLIF